MLYCTAYIATQIWWHVLSVSQVGNMSCSVTEVLTPCHMSPVTLCHFCHNTHLKHCTVPIWQRHYFGKIYFESLRDFLRLSWEKILTTKLGLGFLCHTDSDNKLQVLEGVRLSSKSAPRQTTVWEIVLQFAKLSFIYIDNASRAIKLMLRTLWMALVSGHVKHSLPSVFYIFTV